MGKGGVNVVVVFKDMLVDGMSIVLIVIEMFGYNVVVNFGVGIMFVDFIGLMIIVGF